MRFSLTFALLTLMAFEAAPAQGSFFTTPETPQDAFDQPPVRLLCTYSGAMPQDLGFNDLQPASVKVQQAINTMLKKVGVTNAIPAYVGPVQDAGAVAAVVGNQSVIIYSPDFMLDLYQRTNNNRWSVLSVLAHELGHHLNQHTVTRQGSTHRHEIQADITSGWMLHRLGASLQDALVAQQIVGSPVASATHPAKGDRLAAITRGYNDKPDNTPSTPPDVTAPPIRTELVPCVHRVPCQHRLPCQHRSACTHIGTYGPIHPYDQKHLYDQEHSYDQKHLYDQVKTQQFPGRWASDAVAGSADPEEARALEAVTQLIDAYREISHYLADLDMHLQNDANGSAPSAPPVDVVLFFNAP